MDDQTSAAALWAKQAPSRVHKPEPEAPAPKKAPVKGKSKK